MRRFRLKISKRKTKKSNIRVRNKGWQWLRISKVSMTLN